MWCTQRIPTSSVNQIYPPGPLHEQGPTAITPQLTLEMYSFPSSSRRKHSALSQAPGSGFQVVEMGRQRPVASSRQLSGWSGTRHCPLIQCTRRWSNFCRSYRLFSEMTNLPSVLWWVHGVHIHWSTFYVVYFHQYNKMLFLFEQLFDHKNYVLFFQLLLLFWEVVWGNSSKRKDDSCHRTLAIYHELFIYEWIKQWSVWIIWSKIFLNKLALD